MNVRANERTLPFRGFMCSCCMSLILTAPWHKHTTHKHILHAYVRQIERKREKYESVHAPSFTSSFDDNNDDDDKNTQAHIYPLCMLCLCRTIILPFGLLSFLSGSFSFPTFRRKVSTFIIVRLSHINAGNREIHQFVRWPSEKSEKEIRSSSVYIFVH